MQRLFPVPAADVSVEEAYAAPLGRASDRPWMSLCMVTSIDGSTVVDGRSGQLSSDTDSAILLQLRRLADVVVVGAGTVRAERYGPPSAPGQRIGVVTRSGDVPLESGLFTSGAGFVITAEDSALDLDPQVPVIRAGRGEVDFDQVIRRLGEVAERCATVQVEGGPALNATLLEADLLDEINVTTSPLTVGGTGARLASGVTPLAHRYEIAQLAIDDQSFVFTRWLRRRGG